MSGISAVVIGTDQEQRTVLQMQIDGTAVAKTVHAFSAFPMAVSDAIVRRIQDLAANVIVVDIPRQSSSSALRAIELLRNEIPESAIFAVGDVSQPNVIISAMRAGASEFLERPTTTNGFLEAMIRLASAKRKGQDSSQRGKVFTFVNAKGGAGATTVAVNIACSLQRYGRAVLVDVAPLGHCALYLNLIPSFTLADALRNLQRIDYALLDTYLTEGANGLKVLAGAMHGSDQEEIVATDFASILDLLVRNFDYVVVDASSRLDRLLRLVCNLSDRVLLVSQPDVPSFYNAAKMQEYLGEASDRKRISLILNRFRKLPGFQDTEIENATKTKILYRIPNQYSVVASSIERGIAAVIENHSDLGRAFASLASELSERPIESKARRAFSFFGA